MRKKKKHLLYRYYLKTLLLRPNLEEVIECPVHIPKLELDDKDNPCILKRINANQNVTICPNSQHPHSFCFGQKHTSWEAEPWLSKYGEKHSKISKGPIGLFRNANKVDL